MFQEKKLQAKQLTHGAFFKKKDDNYSENEPTASWAQSQSLYFRRIF
jgi:hypothetical protein